MKIDDLKGIVHSDPEIMGGTPVFVGTRVPPQNLIALRIAVVVLATEGIELHHTLPLMPKAKGHL